MGVAVFAPCLLETSGMDVFLSLLKQRDSFKRLAKRFVFEENNC